MTETCKRNIDCENCGGTQKVLGGVPGFPQIKFNCTSCTDSKQPDLVSDSDVEPVRIISHLIKRHRMMKGLSQGELADSVGCASVTVSHWETGYCKPTMPFLPKLAAALDMPIGNVVDSWLEQES